MIRVLFYTFFLAVGATCIHAQSQGGFTSGAAAFCDSLNSGFISLNGFTGSVLNWQSTENQGASWNNITNPTATQSYNNLKKSTGYRAIVKNGTFPPDTSSACTITVQIKGHTGLLNGGGVFCEGTGPVTISLTGYPGNINHWEFSLDNGLSWSNLQGNSPVISFTNINTSSMYRAIVNVLPVCPLDTSKVIKFGIDAASRAGNITGADSLCFGSPGDTLQLSGFTGSVTGWFSSVNDGAAWSMVAVNDAFLYFPRVTGTTLYKATVKNGACNTVTAAVVANAVYPIHPANAGEDLEITQYQAVTLNGSGVGTPSWSPSSELENAGELHPVLRPETSKAYVLTLRDAHACLSSDTMFVKVIIPLPTAITPNGDGVNDYFLVDKITDYPESSLQIFSRWGGLVYEANPYNNDWDGRSLNGHDLPDDIYYCILDYGNGEKPITNYILIKR